MMLNKIKRLLKQMEPLSERATQNGGQELSVAAAVLFLEMIYADFEAAPEEKQRLKHILSSRFQLSEEQIQSLLEEAQQQRTARQDIWFFTNSIKQNFSREQKLQLLENLWQLIFADNTVDKYEDALIRKITNLIGLEHADMIQTKLRVKEKINP